MIVDLPRFIAAERAAWSELEATLDRLERDAGCRLGVEEAMRFHFLYQKTAADLDRIATFASEPALKRYLESLVARAYSEVHETRGTQRRFRPVRLFLNVFPVVFRRRIAAFWVAFAIMAAGCGFGGFAVTFDDEAKSALLPGQFSHLSNDPAKRVEEEESSDKEDHLAGAKATFSTSLMVNNIRVSIFAMALGMTWGAGTLILLFYNGVILGLVAADYVLAGQTTFLLGWLLPHGVVEIPAILIGGQAGFVIAGALIGRGDRTPMRERLRGIWNDVAVLAFGFAVLLVWAGIIEAFLSQYHAPVLPYSAKIAFGLVELVLLIVLLLRKPKEEA